MGELAALAYVDPLVANGVRLPAALSSTAPIFAAPLAALFLGERLSPRIGAGTVLSILGIWLVL
ncbi:MAG TPA: EamA family transporter [Chloroflexota bacterium]|nr:EamA family transporter [Chloroflexota bacterium]